MLKKKCGKCQTKKSVLEFSSNRARPDGLNSRCRKCCKQFLDENWEKVAAQQREYRQRNKTKLAATRKRWGENNREKLIQYRKDNFISGSIKQKARSRLPKNRYRFLQLTAQRRQIEVTLSLSDYMSVLADEVCYYCGDSVLDMAGSGLDRVDSSQGYHRHHVVLCCKDCNFIKRDHNPRTLVPRLQKMIKALKQAVEFRGEQ